ncbi:MAG: hypothetical protein WCD18_06180 [Thermosynechococcaceae cyanobacterium]
MTETADGMTDAPTTQALAEAIAELEAYRERLVNETMTTVQRAKLPQSKANALLGPELTKIDAMLQTLRDRQAALTVDA